LSHPALDGNGVKAMPGRFKYPGSFNTVFETKKNTGSQMGHTKKFKKTLIPLIKKKLPNIFSPNIGKF